MREIKCPFCESTDAEFFSLYGQTLLGTQYYCNNCRSIFEAIRFDDEEEDESEEQKLEDWTRARGRQGEEVNGWRGEAFAKVSCLKLTAYSLKLKADKLKAQRAESW